MISVTVGGENSWNFNSLVIHDKPSGMGDKVLLEIVDIDQKVVAHVAVWKGEFIRLADMLRVPRPDDL